MKTRFFLLSLLLTAFALSSCELDSTLEEQSDGDKTNQTDQTDSDDKSKYQFYLSDDMLTFSHNGGIRSVVVTVNQPAISWGLDNPWDYDWCTVDIHEKSVTFTVVPYDGLNERTAEYKFYCDGYFVILSVKQLPVPTVQAESSYKVSYRGGLLEIPVETNTEYTVSIPAEAQNWIRYVETRAVKNETIVLDVTPNNSDAIRSAYIDILGFERTNLYTIFVQQYCADFIQFVHRSLLVEFTGTWCGFNPTSAETMRILAAPYSDYSNRLVFSAIHQNDVMAPEDSKFVEDLGVITCPTINIDFREDIRNPGTIATYVNTIQKYADMYQQEPAKAGIAATVVSEENKIIVTVSVKAAMTTYLGLGGWLVEDGIYAKQTNYADSTGITDETLLNTHNNVLRIIDSNGISGHNLGMVKGGEVINYTFVWTLKSEWKRENCSIILFVTTPDENGSRYVTNAVHLDRLSGDYPFEYE